jgi:cbb3-type cytochrome oxidase maturation protein
MSVLVLLIIVGIVVASGFLGAFIWAVRSGQYDDTYTPSVRILFDESTDDHLDNEKKQDPEVKPESK